MLASAAKDELWQVHQQGATGEYDGEIEINVSANLVSSSVPTILEAHSNAAKNSAYEDRTKVPVWCLDSVENQYQYLGASENFFLKIDTQGYEWQVLDGAPETIA
ncbi:MAG: FkbM family methyltransferase [Gammaproteobacteria bacterium]|nr:FkbM family methyltransferase [Gammaproteobacteria bacterium]